ncbi:MAG: SatD family protein [Dehalobacterium sp.]
MELFGVINMDIVNSRRIKERELLQNQLMAYIEMMNDKYQDKLLATPIRITLGDEWQIVLRRPAECYNIIHEFQRFLWEKGIEVYTGFSIGPVSTDVLMDNRMMDGPVFILAREALHISKKNSKTHSKPTFSKRNRVFFHDGGYTGYAVEEAAAALDPDDNRHHISHELPLGKIINLIIENNEILKAKMSPKQKETYIKYFNAESYRKLSKELNESTSSISQKMNIAEYFTIQRNHKMVSQLLEKYCWMRGVQ